MRKDEGVLYRGDTEQVALGGGGGDLRSDQSRGLTGRHRRAVHPAARRCQMGVVV